MTEIPFDPESTGYIFDCHLEAYGVVVQAWFLLDTGASTSMISYDVALELAFDLLSVSHFTEFDSATDAQQSPVVTLAALSMEGARQTQVDVIVHDLPPRLMLDGIIGLN